MDKYVTNQLGAADPANDAMIVVPDTDLENAPRAIMCNGVGGVVTVTTLEGTIIPVTLQPGYPLPLRITRVDAATIPQGMQIIGLM